MIRCVIVDDESHPIEVLKHHLRQFDFFEVVTSTNDPLEALRVVNEDKIDLLFSDIQMPKMSGMDLARLVHGKTSIILTTAYSEFAAEGFDLEVIDYLLKPISKSRFLQAANRILKHLYKKEKSELGPETLDGDYIFVRTELKGRIIKINLVDVDYIEGMRNYIAINHDGQKTLALLNLKDLENRLPASFFVRIHKSYIVSFPKIRMVDGHRLYLYGREEGFPISDSYFSAVQDRLNGRLV
ncbi:LytTR family DNA-binding domain-containing protein [Olivibacter sp. XZL3]|uniref:LytR/AlgR family response regulator transcription factor n=1 Tax=Olivibacter sp. XZL3 TaxID=1735116 RepID=UPI0010662C29|nr:LytTR family DNA-binding domain-containing protein [Olivibacter sp. XZL3]